MLITDEICSWMALAKTMLHNVIGGGLLEMERKKDADPHNACALFSIIVFCLIGLITLLLFLTSF